VLEQKSQGVILSPPSPSRRYSVKWHGAVYHSHSWNVPLADKSRSISLAKLGVRFGEMICYVDGSSMISATYRNVNGLHCCPPQWT
jgi:hypothetical protein